MFRVTADEHVIGDADDLVTAMNVANKYLGVNDLVWNLSLTDVWWSDARYGKEPTGILFYIFEVEDV